MRSSRRSSRRSTLLGSVVLAITASLPQGAPGRAPVPPPDAERAGRHRDEPPAGLTREEWSQIRSALQESEYHARGIAAGETLALEALNQQQGYRTSFRSDGIEIVGTGAAARWGLGVSVTGYGFAGQVRPVEAASPQAQKDKVEYHRGPITEWYVNRPGGLEQGFELEEPAPRRADPLVIELEVRGDLDPTAIADGVAFLDSSGATVIRYTGLEAWDADGRPLRSRLEAAAREIRLVIESQAARFPVTVDPTFVREAKLLGDPGQPNAQLGYAVALSGYTLVAGSPNAVPDASVGPTGSVCVFVRSGTSWTLQQQLVASDGALGDGFGTSVSVSGDTLVVGAPNKARTSPFAPAVGAAYVFVRSGTSWSQQQKLLASDGAADDRLGWSVSIFEDTVVAGAIQGDPPFGPGAAYVFVRSGMSWSEHQKLTASDAASVTTFGESVSISGDTLVVGGSRAGAYVFARAGGTWVEQQKLMPSVEDPGSAFGYSVSVSGDTSVVGARFGDTPGGFDAGSAYVFVRSGATWIEQQKLTAADGSQGDQFGSSVSVLGDTLVVGARGGGAQGSAYVFVRTGAAWAMQQKLVSSANEGFWRAVSISTDTLVVGAPYGGSASVFVRVGGAWTRQQRLALEPADGDWFGYAVALSGDTLVAGSIRDPAGVHAGSAHVFARSGTSWTHQQKLIASDGAAEDHFGWSVAISGDTIVVGAANDDEPGGVDAGSAYVFVRSGTTWAEQQKLTAPDAAAHHQFGLSVAVSGDTAIVGAPAGAGAAYVFGRSGTLWTLGQKLTASDAQNGYFFGRSLSISGDTLAVGAEGAAYVFALSGATWTEQQKLTASDGEPGDRLGTAVSVSEDTLLVGAPWDDTPGGPDAGSAYVFVRSGATWTEAQKLTAPDGDENDQFGRAVSVSGDILVVGAPSDEGPFTLYWGSAYMFVRSGATWSQDQRYAGSGPGAHFGHSVSASVDTLCVGSPEEDNSGGPEAGSVSVFRAQPAETDLGVAQTDAPDPVMGLGPLRYAINVSNLGARVASSVSVVDTLPAAATFQSAGGSGWMCGEEAGVVTCRRPVMAVGAAPGISIVVTAPPEAGSLTNVVSVAHSGTDPVSGNNSASETTTVLAAPTVDLSVAVSDGGVEARWGQPFTWTVTVGNAGPPAAGNAGVADVFPAGVTGVIWTCVASAGSACPASGSGNIATSVSVLPGGTATFTATGTVLAGTASLTNTVTVTAPAGFHDPDPANNSASVTTAAGPIRYYTLEPCRVVDTRTTQSPLLANSTRTFAVGGACAVPADARAVAVILTAVNPSDLGNLRLYPTGQPLPQASAINFVAGRTRANNAILPLGTDGQINVRCDMPGGSAASVHFVLDVFGYFR